MNSFSKTLSPSIRISYLVLPRELMGVFREKLGFYSCTVSSFEQYTLARFISRGHFEKHINRMRKFYRSRRNRVMSLLEESAFAGRLTILEEDAGLHFLVKVDTHLSDAEVTELLHRAGIRIKALSSYYRLPAGEDRHLFVVNYSSLDEQALEQALKALPEQLL
jgi:GntR family transcriptional regulator/MocR family aminotransferase